MEIIWGGNGCAHKKAPRPPATRTQRTDICKLGTSLTFLAIENARLRTEEVPFRRPVVGTTRMRVADVGGEELEEAQRGALAGGVTSSGTRGAVLGTDYS